jgi:hypothetical protein
VTTALLYVISLVSSSVGFLDAEGLMPLIAPQQLILIRPHLWQPEDTLGPIHRPDAAFDINTGERAVEVITDRDDCAVDARGRRAAPGPIPLLGDTFMEAQNVKQERTVTQFLESGYSSRLGESVVGRNAGIGERAFQKALNNGDALVGRVDTSIGATGQASAECVVPAVLAGQKSTRSSAGSGRKDV